MATYYGDALGTSATAFDKFYVASAGVNRARGRHFRSSVTLPVGAASTDLARMVTLPSTARIWTLLFATNAGATAGTVNVGSYYSGTNEDGTIISATTFATTISVAGGTTAETSLMLTSNLLNKGKRLWEIAGLSAEPVTAATAFISIVFTPVTTLTVAAAITQVIGNFSLGD